MIVTKSGIRVVSYVHTDRGLTDCDKLSPEERVKAATTIKLAWLNELFRGKAEFEACGSGELRDQSSESIVDGL